MQNNIHYTKPYKYWNYPIDDYRKKLQNELLRLNKFKRILGDEEFFKITNEKFYNNLIYQIGQLKPKIVYLSNIAI